MNKKISKVQKIEMFYELLRVVAGLLIAYVITLVIIILTSDVTATEVINSFVLGPFANKRRFGQLMAKFIPYLLSGCGMCFIYAAGRFNLISEGIINFAPVIACLVLFNTPLMTNLPLIVNIILLVGICALVGGGVALIPALGREKVNANEMVTSMIMNYMLLFLSLWVLKKFLADRSQSFLASLPYPDNARFPLLLEGTNFHTGIIVAIIGWIIAVLMFSKMKIGTKIRISGANPAFAHYAGINTQKTILTAQFIGGMFAGAAGAVDAFGLYNRYQYSMLTNIGMDALLVAVIAQKKPIFVPLSAFVLAYIRTSAVILNLSTNIPIEFVNMMQAILIFFIAAENFLRKQKENAIFKVSYEEEAQISKGGNQ